MAYDIGLKVGVEGEREFKKAINSINTDMKELGSEATLVASQFDKNDKSIKAVTERNKILNEQIDKQKEKIALLREQLEKANDKYGEGSTQVKKLQTQLNLAEADLNGFQNELENNKVSLEGLGKAFKVAGTTIATAVVAMVGYIKELGEALVSFTTDGAAYADTVLTTATVTGISTQALQEYMYSAELVDVSLETLTGSMKKNIRSMTSAQQGTKQYMEAYEELGVSVLDAEGNLRNSQTVYWEIVDALGKISDETQRDSLAMTVFGKSAQDLNPLITAGSSRLQELAKQAQDAGYVLSDTALNDYGALDDQLQLLSVNAQAARNTLGTLLLPILTDLSTTANDLVTELTKGLQGANGNFDEMMNVIDELMPKVLTAISKYIPEFVKLIGSIATAVADAVTKNLPAILNVVVGIFEDISNQATELLPTLVNAVLEIVGKLLIAISNVLPDAVIAIIDTIAAIFEGEGVSRLFNSIIQSVNNILAKLPQIITALVRAIPVIIAGLNEAIMENVPLVVEGIVEACMALVTEAPTFTEELVKGIPTIVTGLIKGFAKSITNFKDMGKAIMNAIVEGMSEAWSDISSWFGKGNISAVTSGVTDVSSPSVQTTAASKTTSYEAVSQTDLLYEQNELLKQILNKDGSITITNEEIGKANKTYINSNGLVLGG